MSFIQSYIDHKSSEKHNYDVIITGDFNIPNIDWSSISAHDIMCRDSNLSAQHLISFMNTNLMSQYVNLQTRQSNTLDLLISNSDRVAHHVSSHTTPLSDHNLVKVTMPYSPRKIPTPPPDPFSFRSRNIHKADFTAITSQLDTIDWDLLRLICEDLMSFLICSGSLSCNFVYFIHLPKMSPPHQRNQSLLGIVQPSAGRRESSKPDLEQFKPPSQTHLQSVN